MEEQSAIEFIKSYAPVPRQRPTIYEMRRRNVQMSEEERKRRNNDIVHDIMNTSMSLGKIAEKYGVSDQTVSNVAKSIPGYDGKKRGSAITKHYEGTVPKEQREEIYRRFLAGEKQQDIGNDYGVDNWVISYICRQMRAKQRKEQHATDTTTN
jgi:predicted DNA-binding protein YlxM (UPF0122 family)